MFFFLSLFLCVCAVGVFLKIWRTKKKQLKKEHIANK